MNKILTIGIILFLGLVTNPFINYLAIANDYETIQWGTIDDDYPSGAAVDSSGNIYVAGHTLSM